MISQETVQGTARTKSANKNDNRRLRRAGKIPAVVYGAGSAPVSVELEPKQITKILHSQSGHNTIFDLKVGDEASGKVMIIDWQYEPIKGSIMHIDLKRIAMDKAIRVSVPVALTGVAEGVRTQGGIMDQVLREIDIECLPGDIPNQIEADVTNLVFGQVLRVADLPHSDKIKILTSEDQTIAHVTAVKEEVSATAETAATTTAEPEVIKKGKTDEEAAPTGKK
jgi:large subunit ribosomal protein L25